MKRIDDWLQDVRTVAVAGHVDPDGDCIGACMGLYLYLRDVRPDLRVTVYLESYRDVFSYIEDIEKAKSSCGPEDTADLLILADVGGKDRVGAAGPLLERTEKVLCIDHHVTNRDSYTWLINEPQASSACEVICGLLDPDRISPACAAALFTGISNDTGIFRYPSTSPETMRTAAFLMEKGIPFSEIIDVSFYQKTYGQNRILGKILKESRLVLNGRLVIGTAFYEDMQTYQVEPKDMDGIVAELRNTIGAEAAVFIYEKEPDVCKVSLRSRRYADVSRVAQAFGGGGHVRASGCTIQASPEETEAMLTEAFRPILEPDGAE